METCTSSGTIKNEQYNFEPSRQLGTVPLKTLNNLCVSAMKDWKEENLPTYDPWKNTENRNIIRYLIGATKAKKKKFKLAERQRILKLESKLSPNPKRNFKRKRQPKLRKDIAHLIQNLRWLSLEDFDTLLKSIDISKLFIDDNKENHILKEMHAAEVIEKTLVEKFRDLVLCHLKI
ncbi:unnamed protein product [Xylocopa violacea]|uniref:Uncharacterized protein n=1 Tax=Xylocopa violacea TaxID=135666 RepID=A0ABP1PCW8_XYLVO